MKRFFSFIKIWGPVITWCTIIFYMSSLPNLDSGLGAWDFVLRKIAHITEYGILTLLLWRALNFHSVRKIYNWSGFLSAVYAISDEIHQGFVLTRNASGYDILIDVIGVVFAIWLLNRFPRIRTILIS